MKTPVAAAVTALVALSAQARADGMPTPYSLPVTPQVYSWSGFYVGLNGGWAGWFSTASRQLTLRHLAAVLAGPRRFTINTGWTWDTPTGASGLCGGLPGCTEIANTSHTHNEGILGGQIGIQQQYGVFILGLEAAVDKTLNGEDNGASGACVGFAATPNMQCRTSFSELVTVGGRLGWTPASLWLLYASGGFATAEVESKLRALNTAGGIQAGSDHFEDSDRQNGWYVGGGVEFALAPDVIVGAEYQHVDLGGEQVNTQAEANLLTEPERGVTLT